MSFVYFVCNLSLPLPLWWLTGNIKSKLGLLGDSTVVTHDCSQTLGASGK